MIHVRGRMARRMGRIGLAFGGGAGRGLTAVRILVRNGTCMRHGSLFASNSTSHIMMIHRITATITTIGSSMIIVVLVVHHAGRNGSCR